MTQRRVALDAVAGHLTLFEVSGGPIEKTLRPRDGSGGRKPMMKMILAVVALAMAMSGTVRVAIAEDAAERAVLVLDASGSMWGQVENTSKIVVARDVIQKLMSNWNPKVQLGVTA